MLRAGLGSFLKSRRGTRFSTHRPPPMSSPPRGPGGDREEWRRNVEESPPLCLAYVKEHAEQGNPQSVVETIDEFCTKRRMMNVGPNKGGHVEEHIRNRKPLVMAELGSYSGYSAVKFASAQRDAAGPDSHYYAFEYSPKFAEIVREMVAFAGLSNQVTVFVGPFADNIHELKGKTVDMYFIDHEKSLYVSDAKLILESGTLRKGSILATDNVWIPGAPDYVDFLENHPQFMSTLAPFAMGPSGEHKDAVMVSEYLG